MKISIIIPTYNRNFLVKRAIKSVINQSYKDIKIFIIDDYSNDNTYEDLSLYFKKYKNIIFLRNDTNKGVSYSRNKGVSFSKDADFICFLDSDDTWDKEKLKKQLDYHKKNSKIKISQTEDKWFINGLFKNKPKKFIKKNGNLFKESLDTCILSMSSIMIHKSLFNDLQFNENIDIFEDYELFLKYSSKYEIGLVKEPLLNRYSGHMDQLSKYDISLSFKKFKVLFNLYKFYKFNKYNKELVLKELNKKKNILERVSEKYKDECLKENLRKLQI